MTYAVNGISAGQLDGVTWQKSRRSNPSGNCVECAVLPNGDVAVRNSRDPEGPALIYTPAEIEAFLAKVGRVDVEAFRPQHQLDALGGRRLVFDQQHAHCWLPRSRP